jgi:DNA-binding MarR family transcriptional regulator
VSEAPGPRGPLMSPTFWLHHAALAVRHGVETRLKPLGLTYPQFCLLAATGWLTATEGPPTQQQVAHTSGADRMMASKVLRGLEERGLVQRQPHAEDARALRLSLTPEGRSLVTKAVHLVAEADAEFFGTGPERERLRERLTELAQHSFRDK